jgi:hypothetical protein
LWRAPLDEGPGVELLVLGPVDTDGRRTGPRIPDGLPLLVDDLGEAPDVAGRDGDPVDAGDLVDQRGVDPASQLAEAVGVVERCLGPHHRVGVGERVREQVVEGLGDGVGEDERAGDERHAQRDRQAGRE